tara:strand:+ start:211 stop:684 length:474 start_codon:yes stop_codon:yes gene_type:complete
MPEEQHEVKPVESNVEIITRNPVAVGIILDPMERILLQKKDGGYLWHPNKWGFPGGAIEQGENPKEAYLREVAEELGAELEDVQLFGTYGFRDHDETRNKIRSYQAHVFSGRFDGDLSKLRIIEGNGMALLTRHEIDDHPLAWCNKRVIVDFYDSLL